MQFGNGEETAIERDGDGTNEQEQLEQARPIRGTTSTGDGTIGTSELGIGCEQVPSAGCFSRPPSGMASWAMTSFFSPRGFGLGHRDCTRRLLYGMIVYTAGGTRRRADKREAWRNRRWRKVGPRPRSGGERSRCEASEGRGEKGRAGVEQPGARKGVLAAGRRLRAAGCWLLAVAVGCWRVGCWRAAAAPLADRWPLPAVGCCERASRRQRLDQGQHGERRGK